MDPRHTAGQNCSIAVARKVRKGGVRGCTAVLGGDDRGPADLTGEEQGEEGVTRNRQSVYTAAPRAGSVLVGLEGASDSCSKTNSVGLQGHRAESPRCSGT